MNQFPAGGPSDDDKLLRILVVDARSADVDWVAFLCEIHGYDYRILVISKEIRELAITLPMGDVRGGA